MPRLDSWALKRQRDKSPADWHPSVQKLAAPAPPLSRCAWPTITHGRVFTGSARNW